MLRSSLFSDEVGWELGLVFPVSSEVCVHGDAVTRLLYFITCDHQLSYQLLCSSAPGIKDSIICDDATLLDIA